MRSEHKQPQPVLKIFRSSKADEAFVADLQRFFDLAPESRTQLINLYFDHALPYKEVAEQVQQDFARHHSLPLDDVRDCIYLLRFIVQQLAQRDITVEDISDDVQVLGHDKNSAEIIRQFLLAITAKEPTLKTDARVEAAGEATVDTVDGLGFSIDMRAIYDDDSDAKLIRMTPVLIVRLLLGGARENKEVVFQLSMKKLEQFCDLFEKQRSQLKKVQESVTFKSERGI